MPLSQFEINCATGVRDNYAIVAGAACAMLTMAMTGAGWMLCNYLKLQDSMEVAAHKTVDTVVVDKLLWNLYIVTILVPALCVFMGVFAGVRIEILFMRIEGLWEMIKAFAIFVGFYCGVFGLSVGVEVSTLLCSKLAPGIVIQAAAENVPWWVDPMLTGLVPHWAQLFHLFIMFGLLVIMTLFLARDTAGLQIELQALWNRFHNPEADSTEVPVNNFASVCPCGNVYADDAIFCRMCGKSRPLATPALPSLTPRFSEIDINNDGSISRNEFNNYALMQPSWTPTLGDLTDQVQGGARSRASTPPPRFGLGRDSSFDSHISRVRMGTQLSGDM